MLDLPAKPGEITTEHRQLFLLWMWLRLRCFVWIFFKHISLPKKNLCLSVHVLSTLSASLTFGAVNSLVNGEFPSQRTRNADFDVFFNVGPYELLNKQSNDWWLETSWHSCDVTVMWIHDGLVGWRIFVSICFDELNSSQAVVPLDGTI